MSDNFNLELDIEMSLRAKTAAVQLRTLGLDLERKSRDLRRSGSFERLADVQKTIALINNKHSIIASEREKARAKIALYARQNRAPDTA